MIYPSISLRCFVAPVFRTGRVLLSNMAPKTYYEFTAANFRSEGTDLQDPLCVDQRKEVFRKIYGKVMAEKALLVKGPPRSGKTGTLQLLAADARANKKYDNVFCLRGDDTDDFDTQLAGQCGEEKPLRLADVMSGRAGGRVLVLVDEAQVTFNKARPCDKVLWNKTKILMAKNDVHIVFFAMYGERSDAQGTGTPIEFDDSRTLYFDALAFTKSEMQTLANKWNNLAPPAISAIRRMDPHPSRMSQVLNLTDKVVEIVFLLTAGHVGLCRLVVQSFAHRFLDDDTHRGSFPVGEDDLVAYLLSDSLFHAVRKSRAVPVAAWEGQDEETVSRILMEGRLSKHACPQFEHSFVRLKKAGLVAEMTNEAGDDIVMFTSPLLAMQAMDALFGSSGQRPQEMPEFELFLEKTVCRMSHDVLTRTKVHNSDDAHKTLEIQLQVEWYRAAIQLLPRDCIPIVNYGRYHPVKTAAGSSKYGLLDFYVNKLRQLGVELLRNGIGLDEHLARFSKDGGKYSGIALKQWKVVNFVEVVGDPAVEAQLQQSKVREGELRVLWSPSYSTHCVAVDKLKAPVKLHFVPI